MPASPPLDLPPHLLRHVADQDHDAYTPRDHAVWRHVMGQLTRLLGDLAHPSYLEGLARTGIGGERIPRVEEMDACLQALGWRAVPVRGFVPPAVFTEFQARGVLPIAADIRSHEHLAYTPAPDIIHESAGHAPILADRRYAEYLKRCGEAGFKAIASREDQAVYEAIRHLSVVKEDPASSPAEAEAALEGLRRAQGARTFVSESAKASRLYWWTAEYGLVGDLEHPLLYGAGLLSSIAEARQCLGPHVRKLPLSPACVEQDYDITALQPQLYVARDFEHLFEVLEAFEATLAFRRGGDPALEEALRAGTVNHLLLEDGRELTGVVTALYREGGPGPVRLALLQGPCLLSRGGRLLGEPWPEGALVILGRGPLEPGPFSLLWPGGLRLEGVCAGEEGLRGVRGSFRGRDLELPGALRAFCTGTLPALTGGPGDPGAWERAAPASREEEPAEALARRRKAAALSPETRELYLQVAQARSLRIRGALAPERLRALLRALEGHPEAWLLEADLQEPPSGPPHSWETRSNPASTEAP